MIKKLFYKVRLFWIIYFVLLFLSALGGIFIPTDNDIIWVWFWLFSAPFTFFLVYVYGFFIGIWMQNKLRGTTKEILLMSIIYFILMLLLFMVCGIKGILKNGILYNMDLNLYPSVGSALLFALGAFIAKFRQRKKTIS